MLVPMQSPLQLNWNGCFFFSLCADRAAITCNLRHEAYSFTLLSIISTMLYNRPQPVQLTRSRPPLVLFPSKIFSANIRILSRSDGLGIGSMHSPSTVWAAVPGGLLSYTGPCVWQTGRRRVLPSFSLWDCCFCTNACTHCTCICDLSIWVSLALLPVNNFWCRGVELSLTPELDQLSCQSKIKLYWTILYHQLLLIP